MGDGIAPDGACDIKLHLIVFTKDYEDSRS
jgi:hypothetical protein